MSERESGKRVDIIIKSNDAPNVPDELRIHISPELWSQYSDIRRQSLMELFANPNTFFYRNRPPGDRQRYGPFSAEEEQLFMKRLRYFRDELGITNMWWGLFAVPLSGRVGYQCSNFYRLLVKNGKVVDDNYRVTEDGKLKFKRSGGRPVSQDVIKRLEQEAIDYITECIREDNEITKPVKIEETGAITEVESRTARSRTPRAIEQKEERTIKARSRGSDVAARTKNAEPVVKRVRIRPAVQKETRKVVEKEKNEKSQARLRHEKKKTQPVVNPKSSNKTRRKRERATKRVATAHERDMSRECSAILNCRTEDATDDGYEYEYEDNDGYEYDPDDDTTAAKHARDPVTGLPIMTPMIDLTSGLVMDAESWRMVMSGDVPPPLQCGIPLSQPIPLTKEVFHRYRLSITGITI